MPIFTTQNYGPKKYSLFDSYPLRSQPETVRKYPEGGYCTVHEDDWRQIEFVVKSNLAHVENELKTLSAFKEKHCSGRGWTSVHIRKEHPAPVIRARLRSSNLPLFSKKTLVMGSAPPWVGAVPGGFALSEDGDWFIYGRCGNDGLVVHLAVSPAWTAISDRFALVLSQLPVTAGLLLVDWNSGSIVDTSTPESVRAWTTDYLKLGPQSHQS